MTFVLVLAGLAAMLVTGIVSGFETGIYGLSHVRLRYRLSVNDRRAAAVQKLLVNPQQLLTGILLAQNTAVYLTTAIVASFVNESRSGWTEGSTMIALALVLFIFCEAVPKNVFRRTADILVYPLARPFGYFITLMRPAGVILTAITGLVSRISGKTGQAQGPFFTRERLSFYLREGLSEGILSGYQVQLTQNILRAEKVTVARAMVPLEKVLMLPADATIEKLRKLSRSGRFARYPVYRGSRDNIAGVVNIYDCYLGQPCEVDVASLVRPAVVFSVDVRVVEAIKNLRELRQPMGIVADKGRAVGIVTLKDCLEEIVGELYAW